MDLVLEASHRDTTERAAQFKKEWLGSWMHLWKKC